MNSLISMSFLAYTLRINSQKQTFPGPTQVPHTRTAPMCLLTATDETCSPTCAKKACYQISKFFPIWKMFFFFFFFWPCHMACRILVPQPGIELVPPAVEARSLNHWTTREIPEKCYFRVILIHIYFILREGRYFFICLRTTHISSAEFLFTSFSNFSTEFFPPH